MINRTTLAALAKENQPTAEADKTAETTNELKTIALDILAMCEQEARKGKYHLYLPKQWDLDVLNAMRCASVLHEDYGLTVDVDIGYVNISWNAPND